MRSTKPTAKPRPAKPAARSGDPGIAALQARLAAVDAWLANPPAADPYADGLSGETERAREAQAQRDDRAKLIAQIAAEEARRKAHLAMIHLAPGKLCIPQETYRLMVKRISGGRTTSARELTDPERLRLLKEFRQSGWKATPHQGARVNRAPRTKEDAVAWVRALLADAGRLDPYADSIALRSFKVERWEWLDFEQTCKLGQMFIIDARRREAKRRALADGGAR